MAHAFNMICDRLYYERTHRNKIQTIKDNLLIIATFSSTMAVLAGALYLARRIQ